MDELEVLHDVAARLEEAAIPYMVTGSMALNYCAEPRMTRDIDLVLDVRGDEVPQLVSTFRPEYYVPRDAVEKAVQQRSMFHLIHQASILKIDFVLRKRTGTERLNLTVGSACSLDQRRCPSCARRT
jgi:hypothetical protein